MSEYTDKQLLEWAAKAAGATRYESEEDWDNPEPEEDRIFYMLDGEFWYPLEDDGDALRLAVDMKIDIFPWINSAEGGATQARNHQGNRTQERAADNSGCIYSATRRAIVRAAAEIWRAMP